MLSKKKVFKKFFSGNLQNKKKVLTKIFQEISTKNVFKKFFQALHKILTFQQLVLSSSRGLANFRGLEASRPRTRPSRPKPKDFKMCPRGRPQGQGRSLGLHLWHLGIDRIDYILKQDHSQGGGQLASQNFTLPPLPNNFSWTSFLKKFHATYAYLVLCSSSYMCLFLKQQSF